MSYKMNTQFKRWTPEEEQQLLKEVSESLPIFAIAKLHDRSRKAIEIRLQDMSIKMLNSGLSYDDVKAKTGITKELIDERIKTIEEEKKTKTQSYNSQSPAPSPTINTINTILKEINTIKEQLLRQSETMTSIMHTLAKENCN